jgi:dedicated sortase system histidine kinase
VAAPTPRLSVGLRTKLFLMIAVIAAIPAIGVGYVREMESLLREQQEQNLLAAARALAAALNDRPAMRRLRAPSPPPEVSRTVTGPATVPNVAAGPGAAGPPPETAVPATPEAASPSGESVPPPAPSVAAAQPPALPKPPALIATEENAAPESVGDQVEAIVTSLNRSRSRVWVVDRRYRLLALAGSVRANPSEATPDTPPSVWNWLEGTLLRPLYAMILKRPTEDFDDSLPETAISSGSEVERALAGVAGARWRQTSDNRAVIVSAAHPVFAGDTVVAAVVVEESTNAIQSFTARAFEKLISATLGVFVVVALFLLVFASRLAGRIRRLRDEAESAVDAHGRVRALTTASRAGDEIGDLSRSFSQLLERLARYHDYLEQLGARITHEFRTPVAVVRSSLDNLAMQKLPEESREYMRRAEEGLARLSKLITRMSEARRLEQVVGEGEREVYDVREVVAGCVDGYRAAYPQQTFETRIEAAPARVDGSPDLLAQALDKLASNAVGFAAAGTPVTVSVRAEGGEVVIAVENTGPKLPEAPDDPDRERLFDSMISLREGSSDGEPHLGLGLYVVRLVSEFHHGRATAENRADGLGVVVAMRLPMAG